MLQPSTPSEWFALLAIAIPLLIASISGGWAVYVRSIDRKRADWRRIEELMQILHSGPQKGLWAQKLAVDELLSFQSHKRYTRAILKDAASYFRAATPNGDSLGEHIERRLSE